MKRGIESLERLRVGPPEKVFDIMQFTMVYFILSEPLNYFQVRTFDNIDVRWWPYNQANLAAGRTTEERFREDFRHFLWQFGSIDNYWGHPIYPGGRRCLSSLRPMRHAVCCCSLERHSEARGYTFSFVCGRAARSFRHDTRPRSGEGETLHA